MNVSPSGLLGVLQRLPQNSGPAMQLAPPSGVDAYAQNTPNPRGMSNDNGVVSQFHPSQHPGHVAPPSARVGLGQVPPQAQGGTDFEGVINALREHLGLGSNAEVMLHILGLMQGAGNPQTPRGPQ